MLVREKKHLICHLQCKFFCLVREKNPACVKLAHRGVSDRGEGRKTTVRVDVCGCGCVCVCALGDGGGVTVLSVLITAPELSRP